MPDESVWEIVSPCFTPSEFKHPDKIDTMTLLTLYRMRKLEGGRRNIIITINEDYAETGHEDKSLHGLDGICRALDFVIRYAATRRPLPIMDQFFIALRYGWKGLGFYPYWNTPGLHGDTRDVTRRALWWREIEPCKEYPKGKYNYDPFEYLGKI